MVGERRLLVDDGDAALHHLVRIGDADVLAGDGDLALVAGVGTGEDLHQGRLAGAVLADESEDLAGEHVDVDVVAGRAPPETSSRCPASTSTSSLMSGEQALSGTSSLTARVDQKPLPIHSAALVSSIWLVSRTHSGSISWPLSSSWADSQACWPALS